ncbi:MAG: ABC transporter ATP-binding protein [Pseudobacteriovorax sp.]|nr:ABC transporter ATP-binding protein [Pseudobacteriovorax sp.]
MEPILTVSQLETTFTTDMGEVKAVDGVSFSVDPGKTLGLVGESGSGKSVTALSITQLLPRPSARISGGSIIFEGQELVGASPETLQNIRGGGIATIFQEPMTALNPVKTIGSQVLEAILRNKVGLTKAKSYDLGIEWLERVGISDPSQRWKEYPHQLSGGMRQRVMIAMALAGEPRLLIADEPTTALDVTIQAQILDLLRSLQKEFQVAMLFITHDLGVVANLCDHVAVMYAGEIIEAASVRSIFHNPGHPYTQGLIGAIPKLDGVRKTRLATITGMVPALGQMPRGCRFSNRCEFAKDLCRESSPQLYTLREGVQTRCVRAKEVMRYDPPA